MNIKYNYSGYFTKNKRMEKYIINMLPLTVNIILDGHLNKIDKVKIVFVKNRINWAYEFNRLYKNKTITLKVPYRYRKTGRAYWLLVHELCHIKQIFEKELKTGIDVIGYKGKKYRWLASGDLKIGKKIIENTYPKKEFRPWEIGCKELEKHYIKKIKEFVR